MNGLFMHTHASLPQQIEALQHDDISHSHSHLGTNLIQEKFQPIDSMQ